MVIRTQTYHLVHPVLNALARNRWLIYRLFGIRIPRHLVVHFDPTTWLMRHALVHAVRAGDRRVLEMGIGQGGLLSLSLIKSRALQVDGVDCSASRVSSSRIVAAHNQLAPRFFVSDLFSDITARDRYDLIFFNPPYVPTSTGRQLKLTRRMCADKDCVWDGGEDGTRVLREFLRQAPSYLTAQGRVLFGVQPVFLPARRVASVVEVTQFEVLESISRCCLPSRAYILKLRREPRPAVARQFQMSP